MTTSTEKKQRALAQQLDTLACEKYRITLKPRRDGLKPVNFGNISTQKRKKEGKAERFWSCEEVKSERIIQDLTIKNIEGYDIYITPISDDRHFFVIDDLTPETLKNLLTDGYSPALTQRSSLNNVQAVLILPKVVRKDEQQVANSLVVRLNKRYGDRDFCGVVHPFRAAGFFNKKPGRNDAETIILTTDSGHVCDKVAAELEAIRQAVGVGGSAVPGARAPAGGLLLFALEASDAANAAYLHYCKQTKRFITEKRLPEDQDKIDYRCAYSMLAAGWPEPQVAAAIAALSPNVASRHSNVARYATKTVRNALVDRAAKAKNA